MQDLARLWRTVRHLKAVQIVGRARFHLAMPRADASAAPARRAVEGPWAVPARRRASLSEGPTLDFLGRQARLQDVGWDDPTVDRLWRYNLHYFDDLCADGAAQRRSLQADWMQRWRADNPPGPGTAWEPYPTSLRIVNWIKAFLSGMPASAADLDSLAMQTRWLCGRLEWHLLGNHLFANAKALLAAGLFFEGDEAARWQSIGQRILARELPEQILPDGGQFERSPMYHALALEDVLDLLNLARAFPHGAVEARMGNLDLAVRASRMLAWLRAMTHPDGGIALFNDAADGIAPSNRELERYAEALCVTAAWPPAEGVVDLEASGYTRLSAPGSVVIVDAAPIGPDYLVGHAHADTLAFEWSLHGRRWVVNGGTSRYGVGPERLRERGTAWHSTVQVADLDSSEVWSGFRVGRRARIVDRSVDATSVRASHDGWRSLRGRPIHHRHWQLADGALTVTDRLTPAVADAVARFHLAPGLVATAQGSQRWIVADETGAARCRVHVSQGEGSLAPSLHAPRFGERLEATQLAVRLHAGQSSVLWQW